MRVHVLASTVTDNWFYLLQSGSAGVLIDPVDAPVAVAAVRAAGLSEVRVVNTHWHWDHVSGNGAVAADLGCKVWAPAASVEWGVSADEYFAPGDTLHVGDEPLQVLAAPGHTMDHVILADEQIWVSGDVLFVGGMGHVRLGGEVSAAWSTMETVVRQCSGHVRWYPGHDYAAANAAFGLSLLPDDEALLALSVRARGRARSDGPLLVTMDEERAHNVFLRTHESSVQRAAESAAMAADIDLGELPSAIGDAELAFRQLRALRDRWQ